MADWTPKSEATMRGNARSGVNVPAGSVADKLSQDPNGFRASMQAQVDADRAEPAPDIVNNINKRAAIYRGQRKTGKAL